MTGRPETDPPVFPDPECRPGIIASTQTFGDLPVWHPHIHCLVSDDVMDAGGSLSRGARRDGKRMDLLAFIQDRRKVVRILKHLGLCPIEYQSAALALTWPHWAELF